MAAIIPQETYKEIAQQLLERSKRNEVAWSNDDLYEDSYMVRLPQSTVRIRRHRSGSSSAYVLVLEDAAQDEIGQWGTNDYLGSHSDYVLRRDLFLEANRFVTRWDQVVEDIKSAL